MIDGYSLFLTSIWIEWNWFYSSIMNYVNQITKELEIPPHKSASVRQFCWQFLNLENLEVWKVKWTLVIVSCSEYMKYDTHLANFQFILINKISFDNSLAFINARRQTTISCKNVFRHDSMSLIKLLYGIAELNGAIYKPVSRSHCHSSVNSIRPEFDIPNK